MCVCLRISAPARLESRLYGSQSHQTVQPDTSTQSISCFHRCLHATKSIEKHGQKKPLTLGGPDPTGRHCMCSAPPSLPPFLFLSFCANLRHLTFQLVPGFFLLLLLSKPTVHKHTYSTNKCVHTHKHTLNGVMPFRS